MSGAMFIPEFDHETANTRKMLEGLPEEHFDFKPHEKSMSLRELATHLTNLYAWTLPTFDMDVLDLAEGWELPTPQSSEELLALFDKRSAEAREKLQGVTAETLGEDWTLKTGDEVHLTMPKGAVFRFFVLNHIVHHRAHVGLYLRMLDVPVPGMYGPSADEAM